jgi:rhodanese-related sulfurtransferase
MDFKFFQQIDFFNQRLSRIESQLDKLNQSMEFNLALSRNHLVRLKHGEDFDDRMILYGRPYQDLSPRKAFELYHNNKSPFYIIDVAGSDYLRPISLSPILHATMDNLNALLEHLNSPHIPLFVISRDGLDSILVCEWLVKKGFFHVNHISGGYKYWPSHETIDQDF